jgi:hypothetical protein
MRVNQFKQFVVHGFRLHLFSALQRFGSAMVEVILHQVARHTAQGFLHGSHLRNDVGAIAVFFDHFLQAADLSLDAAQALPIRVFQFGVHARGFSRPGARFASAIGKRRAALPAWKPACVIGGLCSHNTLHPYVYSLPLSAVKRPPGRLPGPLAAGCYTRSMTLVEITYELQSPLTEEQLRHLGQFANTYGLRSFRVDESKKQLSFEYDASRLRETQVAHVLGQARIAAVRRVN